MKWFKQKTAPEISKSPEAQIELCDANGKIIKIGQEVRFSEKGRTELISKFRDEVDPDGAMIEFRGVITKLNNNRTVSVRDQRALVKWEGDKFKPEFLVVQ